MDFVIFNVHNVYFANDTNYAYNHDIALLMDQIIKSSKNDADNDDHQYLQVFHEQTLDILYFNDILQYIAISPFYQNLYGHTFDIQSQHQYKLKYLQQKILNLLNIKDIPDEKLKNFDLNHYEKYKSTATLKFNCFFNGDTDTNINESSIDDILSIIVYDLDKNKDLISRKKLLNYLINQQFFAIIVSTKIWSKSC